MSRMVGGACESLACFDSVAMSPRDTVFRPRPKLHYQIDGKFDIGGNHPQLLLSAWLRQALDSFRTMTKSRPQSEDVFW